MMFEKIKLLASDTLIYGVSTVVGRFLTFLLVPFYTNILHPEEYGVVAYVFSLIAFFNVLYGYGMESAYFRYASSLETGNKQQNFSTPFLSLVLTSFVFSLLIIIFQTPLLYFASIPYKYQNVIQYTAWILCFDAIAIIPFAYLRLERKSKTFAVIKFLNIFITIVCNVVFLTLFHLGVEGIFLSALIASIITLILLFPTIQQNITKDFSLPLQSTLLKFGIPYVPAGIATMMVQVVDRPILRALSDDKTVGIYQANYRLGIIMMLLVSVFDTAWRPFFLSHAKEENAKEMFARIFTYFFLVMTVVFLAGTLFIEEIVKIQFFGHYLIHPNYWQGLGIIPVVMLGYLCLGISNNMVAGIYIEKKTKWLPPIAILGAIVNVVANLFLIPSLNIYGAAWATFFSYFLMALFLYVVVQKIYPIQYELIRIGKITLAVMIVYVLYHYSANVVFLFTLKISLFVFFLILLYGLKVFDTSELRQIRTVMHSLRMSSGKNNPTSSNIES